MLNYELKKIRLTADFFFVLLGCFVFGLGINQNVFGIFFLLLFFCKKSKQKRHHEYQPQFFFAHLPARLGLKKLRFAQLVDGSRTEFL